jgi:hypothetical protein
MTRDRESSPGEGPLDELARLPKDVTPPAALRARTLAALRERGLIAAAARQRRRWLATAALLAVAFAAGWLARGGHPQAGGRDRPRFVFLLFGDAPGPEADRVEEYRAWARRTSAGGHVVAGERLGPDGRTAGEPSAGACGGSLRGYFVLDAASLDEALRLARGHPHVRHGGTIVVRPIDPT